MKYRKICRDDVPDLLALKMENTLTHSLTILNRDDQENWFKNITRDNSKNLILLCYEPKQSNTHLDVKLGIFKILNIEPVSRHADIGWDVFSPYRGNGYGHEIVRLGLDFCFNSLNLHRVQFEILTDNIPSRKIVENLKIEHYGIKAQAVYKNGKYHNSLCYSIIKKEYDNLHLTPVL